MHANDYKCSFEVSWICVHVRARVYRQCIVGVLVCVHGPALKRLISNQPPFNLTWTGDEGNEETDPVAMAMQSAFSRSLSPLGPTSARFLPPYKHTEGRINRRQVWKSDEGERKPGKSSDL